MRNKHLLALLFSCWLPLAAQELDLSFLKGLESKATESTDINLGPEQLKLMMGLSGEMSNELQGLGKNIERVQVKTLEFDKPGMFSMAEAEKLKETVKSGNFVSLISVKEKKGFTEIAVRKGPNGQNAGFLILSVEPQEISIVNIVGQLDLSSLGKLTGKLGVPNIQMGPSSTPKKKDTPKEEEEEELF